MKCDISHVRRVACIWSSLGLGLVAMPWKKWSAPGMITQSCCPGLVAATCCKTAEGQNSSWSPEMKSLGWVQSAMNS